MVDQHQISTGQLHIKHTCEAVIESTVCPQKNREMESSRQTSVKCLIVIETSLFFIPDFKNYKFVTYSNFPWPNSWKNKDFTAISKL